MNHFLCFIGSVMLFLILVFCIKGTLEFAGWLLNLICGIFWQKTSGW